MVFIFMMTKRLWPHYLWTGYIFVWLGFLLFSSTQVLKKTRYITMLLLLLFFGTSAYAFYTNSIKGFLTQERKTSQEIKSSLELYQYIESAFPRKSIGLDGTVWYPYKHFILSEPYHPFASERPVICETCIKWHPDQPMKIWTEDVVIFNLRHPLNYKNSKKNNYTPKNWEEIEERFYKETEENYQLHTVIGNKWVYKRKVNAY